MNALIISMTPFPGDSAMAARLDTLARLLMDSGYRVTVFGSGASSGNQSVEIEKGLSSISYRGVRSKRIWKAADHILMSYVRLRQLLDAQQYDIILVTGATNPMLSYCKRVARKRGIVLLHDSVEWYSPEQFALGKWSYGYIKKQQWMKRRIDGQFRTIAISKYLEEHFRSRGIRTVYIPAALNMDAISCGKQKTDSKLVFAYTGSPGKKDYLSAIILGIVRLKPKQRMLFELRVIGVTRKQFIKENPEMLQTQGIWDDCVRFLGRVSRERVLELLEGADFTVLLRPQLRYAQAGFPTKFTESLATSTPVICNITSDLGDYLRDGENGLIVDDCSAESFAKAVIRALSLSREQIDRMCAAARKTAEDQLDYRHYVSRMQRLLQDDGVNAQNATESE